jgi:hypothetical protein
MFVTTPVLIPDAFSYSYLLGLYFGDGCILPKPRGGAQLAVVCDLNWLLSWQCY